MRFCAFRVDDMKNMEEIIDCLGTHLDDLQPVCHDIVVNATAALKTFHDKCDKSMQAVCPEAIGKPTTPQCLVIHLADLEKECLAEISHIIIEMKEEVPYESNLQGNDIVVRFKR